MNTDRRLSVIVPTYNRRDAIARILLALEAQTFPARDFEVVVSIDGSLDGTRELVADASVPYRLTGIWQRNAGRAAACNAGATRARGELLLFLDDDMYPAPDCVASHFAAHRHTARQAVIGAIPLATTAQSPPLLEFLSAKVESFMARLSQPDYTIVPRDFFSSNFSIHRALFFELGGFDESFRVYGNEDVELAFRLLDAGVPVVFRPEAVARQSYDKNFAALARDTLDKGRTAVQLALKHPQARTALSLRHGGEFSRKWRLLRAVLLGLSGPNAPKLTMRLVDYLERRRPRYLHRVYLFALDYLFWIGALQPRRVKPLERAAASAVQATPRALK